MASTDTMTLPAEASAAGVALRAESARASRRLWKSALILAASGVSVGVLLVSALFTDSDSVAANTFTTGTISLTTSPTTALVHVAAMAPGDRFTAPITITNAGTLALRYSATSSTTENVLAGQLKLSVRTGVTTCDNTSYAADGTDIYTSGGGALGNTTPVALFGDATAGSQSGDRTLAAGASEVLCFSVGLPLTTPNGASNANEGVTSTATFTFTSEQTANNS